jgi:hypothetical protein
MNFNQIKPLNRADEIEIDDAQKCCRIFIKDSVMSSTIITLKVSDDGNIKAINFSHLPVINWVPFAKGYERALRYEKMIRFLK